MYLDSSKGFVFVKILYSLLSFREGEMLDDLTYSSSNVGLQQGGLGLQDSSEIVPAAYASSMIAFSQSPTGKELQVTNMVLLAAVVLDDIGIDLLHLTQRRSCIGC
jgi:hypothetical protein